MGKILRLILTVGFLALGACSSIPKESKEYIKFTEQNNYAKTYAIYTDDKLLSKSKQKNTTAKVNLKNQRIRLLVNGRTAVDSPATTGKWGYETPTGVFRVIEKTLEKESNLYGKFYKEGKLVFTGSEKEYKEKHDGEELEYDTYKGAPMDNWLRLTRDGVGIHKSKGIYRRPASHGCIRVPATTSNILYSKLIEGSEVTIIKNDSQAVKDSNKVKQNSKAGKLTASKNQTTSYKDKSLPAAERLRLLRESKKAKKS